MHWMILPFKRYAEFKGRSRRMEFWMFQLLNVIIALVLAGPFFFAFMGASVAASDPSNFGAEIDPLAGVGTLGMVGVSLYGLYVLAAFVPSIAVTVRRLHDRDMSGWWYLGFIIFSFIPIVGLIASIAFLVLMLLPGTPGPNQFGPDPKGAGEAETFA